MTAYAGFDRSDPLTPAQFDWLQAHSNAKWVLAVFALALSAPAHAGTFDKWLDADGPRCVSITDLGSVAKVVTLDPEQFEFLRGLYIAIPPISHSLPSGDHAIVATSGDEAMAALVEGDRACARMALPDWLQEMVMAVGRGDIIKMGDGT